MNDGPLTERCQQQLIQNEAAWPRVAGVPDISEGNSPMLMAGSLLVKDTVMPSPVKDDGGDSDPQVELESASGNSCGSVIMVDDAPDDHAIYYDEVVYVSDDYMEEDDEDDGNSIQMLGDSADDEDSTSKRDKKSCSPDKSTTPKEDVINRKQAEESYRLVPA